MPLNHETWNSLVAACETSSVFVRYEWVSQWWEYFGTQYHLFFLAAENDGEVIGFAPLMRDARRVIRFIGDVNSDYMDFVTPVDRIEVIRGFVKLLAEDQVAWDVINLRNVPNECELIPVLKTACLQNRLTAWMNYSIAAPALLISDFRSDVSDAISKYSMRRPIQRLERKGDLAYRVFENSRDAERYWPVFFAQHIERCEFLGRDSSFIKTEYGLFLRTLFEQDVDRRFTHFSAVFLDDRPIAFHFGFLCKNRLLWYKPCFDIEFSKFSPGLVLIRYLIEYALDNDLDELDFTIGEEPFKNRFCNVARQVDTFRIYHSTFRYRRERLRHTIRQLLKLLVGIVTRAFAAIRHA